MNFRLGSNPSHTETAFLNAVARVHLSHLFQDAFLQAAFKAAEDDGLAPALVESDHPRTLDGGAAERLTETAGHRVLALVEARMKHVTPPRGEPVSSLESNLAIQERQRGKALKKLRRLREKARDEIDRLLEFLDASDLDPDVEDGGDDEDGRDAEPSLGSLDRVPNQNRSWLTAPAYILDCELDDCDDEPSLGSSLDSHGNGASYWHVTDKDALDTEDDAGDNREHENEDGDGNPDHEPALGWPEVH